MVPYFIIHVYFLWDLSLGPNSENKSEQTLDSPENISASNYWFYRYIENAIIFKKKKTELFLACWLASFYDQWEDRRIHVRF